jgi:Tfp pilus assembly protein PilF
MLRDAKALFFTPAAKAELQARRPDLLAGADESRFARAAQNPSLFRQLDHRDHFDAALLAGDPGAYRPLLQHLLESRDWVLTNLDSAALVFRRAPAAGWSESALGASGEKFTGADRAYFLMSVAGKLLAIGKPALAKKCLDESLELDRKSPATWTQMAVYDGQVGRWADALTDVQKALSLDRDFTPALATKAEILFGAKRFRDALEVSSRLIEKTSTDPAALFLHAKIAHEAHDFAQEIVAMQSLVALAEKHGEPTSGYRIFLGQAYAHEGRAQLALDEFSKAIAAGDLSPEQLTFVQDSIARIKARSP